MASIAQKIAQKSSGMMDGIFKSNKTFGKSILKNAKIKKRLRVADIKAKRKRREDKKRKDQEELREQQDSQKKEESQKSKGSGGGPLERIMAMLQALLVGFVLNKLPKIIEFLKKVIKVIRDIVDKFKAFFDGVVGFFTEVGKVITKAYDVISNLKITDIGDKLKKLLDGVKDAFGNMKDMLFGGILNFNRAEKKKPRKEINREIKDKDLTDDKLKESVNDVRKTMSSKSKEFNNTIQTIEKVGTGVDIVGPQNASLTEQVQSTTVTSDGKETNLVTNTGTGDGSGGGSGNGSDGSGSSDSIKSNIGTISFDGKTYPMGSSGLGGFIPGAGEGGSTYKTTQTADFREIKAIKESYHKLVSERKSENTVIIVDKRVNDNSSVNNNNKSKGQNTVIIENDTIKDQFILSTS